MFGETPPAFTALLVDGTANETAKGSTPEDSAGLAACEVVAALRGLCGLGWGAAKGSADVNMAKGSESALGGVGAKGRGPDALRWTAAHDWLFLVTNNHIPFSQPYQGEQELVL